MSDNTIQRLKSIHERLDALTYELRDDAHQRGADDSMVYDLRALVDEFEQVVSADDQAPTTEPPTPTDNA